MSREDFSKKKMSIEEARLNQNKDKHRTLAHLDIQNTDKLKSCPFLLALAEREVIFFLAGISAEWQIVDNYFHASGNQIGNPNKLIRMKYQGISIMLTV